MLYRKLRAAAGVVVLVGGLAACGGGADTTTTDNQVTDTTTTTTGATDTTTIIGVRVKKGTGQKDSQPLICVWVGGEVTENCPKTDLVDYRWETVLSSEIVLK